jgi:hypothetical protein
VTFYSAGCNMCGKQIAVGLTAGSVEVAYIGPIYDGEEKLVHKITANRFVTFRLTAGPHAFAGQNVNGMRPRRDDAEKDLNLVLLPNQHYFIRFTYNDKGVYLVRHYTTLLSATDCSTAFAEAHKSDPVPAKQFDQKYLSQIISVPYFPTCNAVSGASVDK